MKLKDSLGALGDPRFAWYFTARTVSTAGSVMVPVALAFAVLDVDQSAGALAQVLGVRTLVMVLFLLVGGVVADRFSRIVVLQVSHVLTCLTQASAAWLIISGHATLTQLTVIEGVNGAVSAFTMPAMMGIVPLVVDRTRLQQANALLSFSRSGLGIIGPAVAGLLVVGVGPGWALAVDALTYVVAILCLTRVRLPSRGEEARSARPSMVRELREGWSEFTAREWLWVIVLVFGVTNAIHAGVVGVLGPLIARQTPAIGEAGWGLILSAEAVGTVLMTLVMLRLRLAHPLRAGMIATSVLAVPMVLLGLAPAVWPLALGFFLAGAAIEVFGVGWSTALHEHVPVAVLSRVSSYDALGSFVAIPVGTFLYGWLATLVDTEALLLVSALLFVAVSLSALLSGSVRHLGRSAEEPVDSRPGDVPPGEGTARVDDGGHAGVDSGVDAGVDARA
ncbi:MFS transporter [Intrasporangium oryzae NRRL B-24470]|uniref:MFS transporter n=1 Tax=Intrasporangium oryzae NRRL B-24470 TaxID=1386089 RepID=W9GGD6_9MICO|nr:MFS transporter [Intrasporangium oryzae]EWT02929.1 MFS transporter [Intrasporangium oryzae NRRL B-24470]